MNIQQWANKAKAKTWLPAILLVLFLLLYMRPYHGIRHDAVLYLGQALLWWKPEQFSNDLFFAYGSQAQFTILPQLAALFFQRSDASSVFEALTLLGLISFLAASWTLVARLLPAQHRFWALLALLILPSGYGGHGIFSYAEPFFTGRSIAEPLVLLALAAWLSARRWMAGGVWLIAVAIHPLQALPALIVVWIDLVRTDRRWLSLLLSVVPMVLAGAFGIAPFDRLLTRYDAHWLEWVQEPSPHLFLTLWQPSAWGYMLTDLFLVWQVGQRATGTLKSFARSLVVTTLLCTVASLVLVDGLNLVLPTALQLWRAQWLLHWLAMMGVPWLLFQCHYEEGAISPRLMMLVAIVVFGVPAGSMASSSLAVVFLIPLFFAWPAFEQRIRPGLRKFVAYGMPVLLLLALAKYTVAVDGLYTKAGGERALMRPEFVLFSYPLVSGGLVAAGLWLWQRRQSWRVAGLFLLLPALAYAASEWDRRSKWTRYIESAQHSPRLFGIELRPGAQVFWDGELVAPWLILNRPSYFNGHQTAGLLFNRGTAEEAVARMKVIEAMAIQSNICSVMNTLNKADDSCSVDDEIVTEMCEQSGGKLDYLVLDSKLKTPALGAWSIVGGLKGDRQITYRLYQCRDFIAGTRYGTERRSSDQYGLLSARRQS